MTILDSASEMPYKIFILVGFITGTVSSFVAGHAADLILTFVFGILSALGAAFGKYVLGTAKKHIARFVEQEKAAVQEQEDSQQIYQEIEGEEQQQQQPQEGNNREEESNNS